jgi:sterol desaturase/sphingolipid hydroxylase (fatty acid hydroxylase superfamily)
MEFYDVELIRFVAFAAIFAGMATLERIWPRRTLRSSRLRRWPTNLAIVALGAGVVRLLALAAIPLTAVGVAAVAARYQWGLLNLVGWNGWIELAIALVVLDFALWLQHVLSHRIPVLWRLHQMHHADIDFDVTTALRFHPLEIGLSMLYKALWVIVLGPSVAAVVVFEIVLNGLAVFNHSNAALPNRLDRMLRLLVVTPDMHRVHHSIDAGEHHRNFGFNLAIWDRMFATYKPQPALGHDGMTIGLPAYQNERPTQLWWSLALPFRRRDRE